ncbi:hypothetical protein [Streptomyces sp. NPDC093109]|uniref:hypothetical protein n=1 Tax=Streptomyces sp. NPDC093109 TaxID=3154977 RepID=UPI00344CA842
MSSDSEQNWGQGVSTTPAASVSAAELRRRVRAVEALQAKTREMAAANVLTTRETATKAARAKDDADIAAREAAAVALRLFDNDAELVSELLDVPAEELEREAKPVTAARAKKIIEVLRAHAERPRSSRPRKPRTEATAPSPPARETPAPVSTRDDNRADVA